MLNSFFICINKKTINKIIKVKSKILVQASNDPRSYRQNSNRLLKIGFKKDRNINDAIKEIEEKFYKNKVKYNNKFFRINTLKMIGK